MVTVAVDTNVLISALVGHGKPRRLVTKLLEEHALVTSREMLAELADVLARAKFVGIKSPQVSEFLLILVSKAVVVRVRQCLKVIVEDPDDNIVLSTAYEGKANYVVSGDKHLLNLKDFRGIRIVTVKEMLDLLHVGRSA
jgi:putative PIN family toxin of toxin-antitoxin system